MILTPERWAQIRAESEAHARGLEDHRLACVRAIRNRFLDRQTPADRRSYHGLARERTLFRYTRPKVIEMQALGLPWGWRTFKEPNRNAVHLMPAWLYWLVRLRHEWRWPALERLTALGLLEFPYDGALYSEMRPTLPLWLRRFLWCFLNDRDHTPLGFNFGVHEDLQDPKQLAAMLSREFANIFSGFGTVRAVKR